MDVDVAMDLTEVLKIFLQDSSTEDVHGFGVLDSENRVAPFVDIFKFEFKSEKLELQGGYQHWRDEEGTDCKFDGCLKQNFAVSEGY